MGIRTGSPHHSINEVIFSVIHLFWRGIAELSTRMFDKYQIPFVTCPAEAATNDKSKSGEMC